MEICALLPKYQMFTELVQVQPADLVKGGGVHVFDSFELAALMDKIGFDRERYRLGM